MEKAYPHFENPNKGKREEHWFSMESLAEDLNGGEERNWRDHVKQWLLIGQLSISVFESNLIPIKELVLHVQIRFATDSFLHIGFLEHAHLNSIETVYLRMQMGILSIRKMYYYDNGNCYCSIKIINETLVHTVVCHGGS